MWRGSRVSFRISSITSSQVVLGPGRWVVETEKVISSWRTREPCLMRFLEKSPRPPLGASRISIWADMVSDCLIGSSDF